MNIKINSADTKKIEAVGHLIKSGAPYRNKGVLYKITDWRPVPDGIILELMELI